MHPIREILEQYEKDGDYPQMKKSVISVFNARERTLAQSNWVDICRERENKKSEKAKEGLRNAILLHNKKKKK